MDDGKNNKEKKKKTENKQQKKKNVKELKFKVVLLHRVSRETALSEAIYVPLYLVW